MPKIFFPYNYYEEALNLEITELNVDEGNNNSLIDNEKGCINLYSLSEWEKIKCKAILRLPSNLPAKITANDEKDDWKAILIIKSMVGSGSQIGWRRKIILESTDESNLIWHGELQLIRKEEGPWVEIQAYLTRSKEIDNSDSSLAHLQGQRLASSSKWYINIDERVSPLGKSIKIEWINFQQDHRFDKFSNNVYYIDFSENVPVLYLNEAIEDLKVVLNSKGYKGSRAAVRESLFRSVAQPVWLSLILVALSDSYEEEEIRPEWQKSVISQYAPLVFPDEVDLPSAIQQLKKYRDKSVILLPKLISAIQSSVEIDRSTTRLLQSIIQK